MLYLPSSDWGLYVLHGIVNGHPSGNTSSRRIDVHVNWFCATLRLNKNQIINYSKQTIAVFLDFTCRNSNWATISELILSLMPPIKQMILSLSNREKISYERSPRPVCSITIGTRPNIFRHVVWICRLRPKFCWRNY